MAKHLLTDRHIRNAKPKPKPYRLFDGDGLALWISPTGAKSWQLRYRLAARFKAEWCEHRDRHQHHQHPDDEPQRHSPARDILFRLHHRC